MAVIDMCKMSLIAHSADRSKILRELVKLGVVEAVRSEKIERTTFRKDTEGEARYKSLLAKLNFVFTFLRERNYYATKRGIEVPVKLDLTKINRLFNVEEFESTGKNEYDLLERVAEIEELNMRLVDNTAKAARLTARREQLVAYRDLDIKFSEIKDTKSTCLRVGMVSLSGAEWLAASNKTQLETDKAIKGTDANISKKDEEDKKTSAEKQSGYEGIIITKGVDTRYALGAFIFLRSKEQACMLALAQADFMPCPFNEDIIASEEIAKIDAQLQECEALADEITAKAVSMFSLMENFKILYDYYLISLKKLEIIGNASTSGSAFLLEGWIPEPDKEKVHTALSAITKNIYIDFRPPMEGEHPPVYVKSSKAVAPFQGITNMYGYPNPKEGDSDPNFFVAIFYFLFFGIMMGDAGYGIIIALACFAFYYFKKPKKGSGNMILVFGFCGISTFIWGVLFAGWFGIDKEVLEASGVGRLLLKLSWFSPLEEPLMMFGLALALGALQIAVGFGINAYNTWRRSKAQAILNNLSWVIILLGLGVVVLGMLASLDIAGSIGMALVILGAAMLIVGGTLGKKGIIKKVSGSFGNIYGGINVFSDILSYSRLFGLGLTTGVIAMVINYLANIIIEIIPNFIGYIAAFVILIIGHTFNLGINLLGTYVHNSRLQYIEFFSKFYQGTGKPFQPLGSQTKYIFLDN